MNQLFLVSIKKIIVGLGVFVALAPWCARGQTASFGLPIELPGEISELVLDEGRGLVYAGNFTAGRVEVVSMHTHQRITSFPTSPVSAGVTALAMSPNRQYLVAANVPVTYGVNQLSGVTIVNLNDPSERRFIAMDEQPLSLAFGANNKAVMITPTKLREFDPVDGSVRDLFDFESGAGEVSLPVPPPTGFTTLADAKLVASGDGNWIFGLTSQFVFSYKIRSTIGLLTIRETETFANPPVFQQIAAAYDGSYFMAGQLLLTQDIRVIADTPEAPESDGFVGGIAIDKSIKTVYGSYGEFADTAAGDDGSHPRYGILQYLNDDNLLVRSRLRLTERITGRIVVAGDGRYLYAISESGIMHLPLSELSSLPQLEVNAEDRDLMFQFDFCQRGPITQTMRIENPPGGEPAMFRLSVDDFSSSGRPAVLFEPHVGVTPAEVRVTVDPGSLGPVQGTNALPINIETDAVNIPQQALVISNIRDVDQAGNFHQIPGYIVAVEGDPIRNRFYALDQENFRVIVYDSQAMRQIGEFRTGNTPSWMTVTRDGAFLVVANSRGENLTIIDLANLKSLGLLYMPWQLLKDGHYPQSVSSDHADLIVGVRTSGGSRMTKVNLPSKSISSPETLGIFTNSFSSSLAVAGNPDGSAVLLADDSGTVALWEAASQRLIQARSLDTTQGGAVGAGVNYYVVGSAVLNSSLVQIGEYDDGSAAQESSGFAVLPDGTGVRSVRPLSQVDTGALQKLDSRAPHAIKSSTRMVDPPSEPQADFPFTKTLASLIDGRLVSTSSAGVVEFPRDYDAGRQNPRIAAITNGADFTDPSATGGLITIFGDRLSGETVQALDAPLPKKMAQTCVSANGAPLPLLYVSPNQINAQIPFTTFGSAAFQVHSNGGVSDLFLKQVSASAPAIFGVRGPDQQRYAAVFRENNTLATLSNPVRPGENIVIYMTGLGPVSPFVVEGEAASMTVLSETTIEPTVTFGGAGAQVLFSGLTPGFVGLYQLNTQVPGDSPLGLQVPLQISGGSNSTTVNVRIID